MNPQDFGFSPVTPGQALGVAGEGNLAQTPVPGWQKILDLPGIKNLLSQAGKEVPDLVKQGYARMSQGGIPLGSAFNALSLAPLPSQLIQQMLQKLNPQG